VINITSETMNTSLLYLATVIPFYYWLATGIAPMTTGVIIADIDGVGYADVVVATGRETAEHRSAKN